MRVLSLVLLAACSSGTDDEVEPMYELPQIVAADSPICLSYEPTTLDETRPYATTFRNDGRQQLIIESATIIDDERGHFSLTGVEPLEVNTFDFAHVMVRYHPTVEGWDTALLEVRSNAQNYPLLRIFVLALGRPAGAPDTWDPGMKPEQAFEAEIEACKDDYKPRQ